MSYLTVDEVQAVVGLNDSLDSDEIDKAVAAVSRLIDDFCGQHFGQRGTAENPQSRVFTLDAQGRLRPGPVVSVAAVEVDRGDGFVELDAGDWRVTPVNAPLDGEPYREIVRVSGVWPTAADSIRVSGVFGWPEVPPPVREAALLQVNKLHKLKKDAPLGIAPTPTMDGVGLRLMAKLHPEVELLLLPYRPVLVG